MRCFRLFVLCVVLGLVVCGCKDDDSGSADRKDSAMGLTIKWLGHASFRISYEDTVIYIDPWKLKDSPHDADLVLVSHKHHDHYSREDVASVSGPDTRFIASRDVVAEGGVGQTIIPGLTVDVGDVGVRGMPAYNTSKQFHPKSNQWVGFVIDIGGKRIYYAGDTDVIDEMKMLKDIDVALVPVGGTYTMNAAEAAEAVGYIKPKLAVPYHWGDIVGSESDATSFAEKAGCEVKILKPGESVGL